MCVLKALRTNRKEWSQGLLDDTASIAPLASIDAPRSPMCPATVTAPPASWTSPSPDRKLDSVIDRLLDTVEAYGSAVAGVDPENDALVTYDEFLAAIRCLASQLGQHKLPGLLRPLRLQQRILQLWRI